MAALQVTSYAATLLAAALAFELAALPVSRAVGDGAYFLLLGVALVTGGLAVGDTVVPLVVCLLVTGLSWFMYWRRVKKFGRITPPSDDAKDFWLEYRDAKKRMSSLPGVGRVFGSTERKWVDDLEKATEIYGNRLWATVLKDIGREKEVARRRDPWEHEQRLEDLMADFPGETTTR